MGYRRCGMLSNALESTPCATRLQQVCNKNIKDLYRTFFSEAIHWKVSFFRVPTSGATVCKYIEVVLAPIEMYLLDVIPRQRVMSKTAL
jgi:hypothetical protein